MEDQWARLEVNGRVFYWRGPAPFHFFRISGDNAAFLKDLAPLVTYGWGMIPVAGRLGATSFTTALIPKDGGYLVPLKDAVRSAEGIDLDDEITVHLEIGR